ncbi:hypothetical protein BsWGS_20331 [Bradybaena similaris]
MQCISKKPGFILNRIQQNIGGIKAAVYTPCKKSSQTTCNGHFCSRRDVHTDLKLCIPHSPQNGKSSEKKSSSDVTVLSSEKHLKQIDIGSGDKEMPQESSLPTHDVQRITPDNLKLELKAKNLFDEVAVSRGFNKTAFLTAVNAYIAKETLYRRGAVEFIYVGMKKMKLFGVEKDLMAYKALIQVLPEGKMIPRNVWQVEFMHYPRQQQCGIDLLEQMENHSVIPDDEFGQLLRNRFGVAAHVTRKLMRMMYWLPKFKNWNPYPIPFNLPADPIELALVALKRMCVDLETKYTVYKTADMDISHEDDTFIVSAQSPTQQSLISRHSSDLPLFVEGPYPVYLRDTRQHYFILRDEPDVKCLKEKQLFEEDNDSKLFEWTSYFEDEQNVGMQPAVTVHQQEDSTVLGLCITGASTKSSVVTWIRCLEKHNPNLSKTPVIFKLNSPDADFEAIGDNRPFKALQK